MVELQIIDDGSGRFILQWKSAIFDDESGSLCIRGWSEWQTVPTVRMAARSNAPDVRNPEYQEMAKKLNDPDGWDIPGIIADVRASLHRGEHVPSGTVLAIIDYALLWPRKQEVTHDERKGR